MSRLFRRVLLASVAGLSTGCVGSPDARRHRRLPRRLTGAYV
ncbi:hypothetical protein [Halogeometricum limi]|nr:hypothetical protein [Halogeometricum limi]